ncbi:MAG: hypothetical protein ACRD3T_17445 [Terriglobia bacterium]
MIRRRFLKAGCAAALMAGAGVTNAESLAPANRWRASGRGILGVISGAHPANATPSEESALPVPWTHYARIAGYGLRMDRVDHIIEEATASHVFGIETDNDITGRYESFIDPTEKLRAIKAVAEKAHAVGNYAFIYISGLECITAHAPQTAHTLFKDHPDWVQRDIKGKPAIFGYPAAFWIARGDEDAWITPYAPGWRKMYMQRVRQIAATGIDGVYVDIPYWMTHYTGWEKTWASFDDFTIAAFKRATGLNARTDIKLGDYNDPGFIRWIDFRIRSITDFMREINETVKSENPKCLTIAEIWPGIEADVPQVGADPYELYQVVDVICHEYEFGNGDHMAAGRTPLNWFDYQTGYSSFRAFAQGKPSWILNYSWDGETTVDPRQAMQNLAMSELTAGCNTWDARGHVMSGSNDIKTRTEIFAWIAQHEETFYSPRQPMNPIGVYFSPKTRDYFPEEFIQSYRGILCVLLQSHLEFQIITPRTLDAFAGNALILADVKCTGDAELRALASYVKSGRWLMLTGETASYDDQRRLRNQNPLHHLLGIINANQRQVSKSGLKILYDPGYPARTYYQELQKQFNDRAADGSFKGTAFDKLRRDLADEILHRSGLKPTVVIQASPFVSTQIARVNGKLHIYFANFKGLKAKEVAVQIPEERIIITFTSGNPSNIHFLQFLEPMDEGKTELNEGTRQFIIPELKKGAVVWSD